MNPAMFISKTGLQAQDAKLQEIANNPANVNTVGFKRDRAVFADLFYQVDQQPGAQQGANTVSPTGVQLGNGTRLVGTQKVFTTGNLQTTGQSLDVAIVGNGFLQVEMENGETGYTRAGQLQLNADGRPGYRSGFAGHSGHHHSCNSHQRQYRRKRYGVGHSSRCHGANRNRQVTTGQFRQPDRFAGIG
nr:flagellar hook-basal body complex protein [Paludibacterium denitrificans]